MGIQLTPQHVAYRMNLVTLDKRSEREVIMISHSSRDISTPEASEIVEDLKHEFKSPDISIHAGVAYRHLFVWEEGPDEVVTIPPHDVLEQNMAPYLNNATGNPVPQLIRKSWQLLDGHPVNLERERRGLKEANSIWLWGQGKPPQMPTFEERYGLKGGVISAVDLLKGIGVYAGFVLIHVEGATGYIDTNYVGKAEAALKGLKELQFIFLHVEAPDEAGHHGDYEEKIKAIEYFDERVVGTVLEGLRQFDDYRIMVVSDHLTPVAKRTHTEEPTPFAWASRDELETQAAGRAFSEKHAIAGGTILDSGEALMRSFLNRA